MTSKFQRFLAQLESVERLFRLVMDECHTSLTYKEYRPMIMGDVVRFVRRADSFDEDTSD